MHYLTKLKVLEEISRTKNILESKYIFECNLIVCWRLLVVVVSSFKEQTHITPSINYYYDFSTSRPYCISLQYRLFLNLQETYTANLIFLCTKPIKHQNKYRTEIICIYFQAIKTDKKAFFDCVLLIS